MPTRRLSPFQYQIAHRQLFIYDRKLKSYDIDKVQKRSSDHHRVPRILGSTESEDYTERSVTEKLGQNKWHFLLQTCRTHSGIIPSAVRHRVIFTMTARN